MPEFNGQSVIKFLTKSKTILVISLLVLIVFSYKIAKEIINRRDLNQEIGKLQAQVDSLNSRNQEISGLIDYFKSNNFVENEARTKLNLRKDGEKIIIVPEDQPTAAAQPPALTMLQNLPSQTISNAQRWWNYFFNSNLQ